MAIIGNNPNSSIPSNSVYPAPRDPQRFDGASFAQALSGGLRVAGDLFTGGGLGLALSGLQGLGGGSDQLQLQQLIDRQMQSQMQMQVFSAQSNIEKTKHDTRMTAIQNMRA